MPPVEEPEMPLPSDPKVISLGGLFVLALMADGQNRVAFDLRFHSKILPQLNTRQAVRQVIVFGWCCRFGEPNICIARRSSRDHDLPTLIKLFTGARSSPGDALRVEFLGRSPGDIDLRFRRLLSRIAHEYFRRHRLNWRPVVDTALTGIRVAPVRGSHSNHPPIEVRFFERRSMCVLPHYRRTTPYQEVLRLCSNVGAGRKCGSQTSVRCRTKATRTCAFTIVLRVVMRCGSLFSETAHSIEPPRSF